MTTNTDPVRALAALAERAVPFLLDEAAKYDDDGSNEPLELARDIESLMASLPSDESALPSANSAFDGGREAALASAPPSAGEVPPEDRFEQFVQAEIARSPNALRELGCYLADVLDEDRFPRANRLLLQLATEYAPPSAPAGVEGFTVDGLAADRKEDWAALARLTGRYGIRYRTNASMVCFLRAALAQQPAPVAPVGVEQCAREAVALSLDERGFHQEAQNVREGEDLDEYRDELLIARIAAALAAQQPAAPSGEAVVEKPCLDCGVPVFAWADSEPVTCLGCHADRYDAAPQQPAGVGEGLTDEAIERALDAPLGLDHTLRQLIRGDTVPVGFSKVDVVRELLRALAAQHQGGADHA